VVVIGATNRPDELDEGARRRFVKRLYIPLPDEAGREQLIMRLLLKSDHSLAKNDLDHLVKMTKGFSGADIRSLCTEAAMGPVRLIIRSGQSIDTISESDVPPIAASDFFEALEAVAPSVSENDLTRYIEWNSTFGTYRKME
jgi:SpoVK/Ycf46/Vps4 family AAA+-type ATPase